MNKTAAFLIISFTLMKVVLRGPFPSRIRASGGLFQQVTG